MNVIPITSCKVNVVFRSDALPQVNPSDPQFILDLTGLKIHVRVNAKVARKLAAWPHGAVLQGRLGYIQGQLCLQEAGFQFIEPRPVTASAMSSTGEPS